MGKDTKSGEHGEYAAKDYHEPPPAPLIDVEELGKWSSEYRCLWRGRYPGDRLGIRLHDLHPRLLHRRLLWRAHKPSSDVWPFLGTQSVGDPCHPVHGGSVSQSDMRLRSGEGIPEGVKYGGGANELAQGYEKGVGVGAEIIGTFVLVYAVFSVTDPKRNARDSHVPVLAPLPIGFAVFMVHLATIPIMGTGINHARSFGAAVIYNQHKAWHDHWIFWVGPFVGEQQLQSTTSLS
ncbi:hypothetical protein MLD38_011647 [Melastoma candidum]|uniref:Uncharacterized protein n=1 Tax=Melastoma candidum TaxID=119954 RepID=A0ACB9R3Q0_9MYRT|nr:hypothetical protein MLD38_011647 [Melastoma candidum]